MLAVSLRSAIGVIGFADAASAGVRLVCAQARRSLPAYFGDPSGVRFSLWASRKYAASIAGGNCCRGIRRRRVDAQGDDLSASGS